MILDQLKIKYPDITNRLTDVVCESGWFNILDSLFYACNRYVLLKQYVFSFRYIKEKFGELRIYYDCFDGDGNFITDPVIENMCELATYYAAGVCEITGNIGKMRYDVGWIRVLSDLEYLKKKV